MESSTGDCYPQYVEKTEAQFCRDQNIVLQSETVLFVAKAANIVYMHLRSRLYKYPDDDKSLCRMVAFL
jgi:hypothetical protein